MIQLFPAADGVIGSDDRGFWLTHPFTLDLPAPPAVVVPPDSIAAAGFTSRDTAAAGFTAQSIPAESFT